MKLILILLAVHLVVCSVAGYWSRESRLLSKSTPTEEASMPANATPANSDEGFLPGTTETAQYLITIPRPVVLYGVFGLIGLVIALIAKFYRHNVPHS